MVKHKFIGKNEEDILRVWWEGLGNTRGDRARLRRCKTVQEVFLQPAYIALCKEIGLKNSSSLAAIAGLLSHVEVHIEDKKVKLAKQMGQTKLGQIRPLISEVRFQRILRCKDRDDLYLQMFRIIKLFNKTLNIYDLASSLYYWGDRKKKEWAYDYYSVLPQKSNH